MSGALVGVPAHTAGGCGTNRRAGGCSAPRPRSGSRCGT